MGRENTGRLVPPICNTNLEFSPETRIGQVWGLGEEIEEFLRPEKRGKHVTELHESFIRL